MVFYSYPRSRLHVLASEWIKTAQWLAANRNKNYYGLTGLVHLSM